MHNAPDRITVRQNEHGRGRPSTGAWLGQIVLLCKGAAFDVALRSSRSFRSLGGFDELRSNQRSVAASECKPKPD